MAIFLSFFKGGIVPAAFPFYELQPGISVFNLAVYHNNL
jgi:hypothetical protein